MQNRIHTLSAVETLRRAALALAEKRHVLSGLDGDIEPIMRTIAASPALVTSHASPGSGRPSADV